MKSIVNSKNNRTHHDRGFTLIEVMLALGIMAMSFAALLQLSGTAMRTSTRAETITVGTMLARQKMAELMIKLEKDALEGKFPGTDEESGSDFDAPFETYKWQAKIRKVEIPVPPQEKQDTQAQLTQMIAKQIGDALREVKLTVSWGEPDEKQEVVVTTHVVKK